MLAACAKTGSTALDLTLTPTLNTVRTENKVFTIKGEDLRAVPHIAIVNDGKQTINTALEPAYIVQNTLAEQFSSQGFSVTPNNRNIVKVDLLEALSNVEDSIFSHKINTNVKVKITAQTELSTFTKTYSGNAVDKGFSKVSDEKVNSILSNLFSAVLNDIADDPELNLFINENFWWKNT